MKKKNFKGRCEKRMLEKCKGVCRTYDSIQYAYADMLESDENVKEFLEAWFYEKWSDGRSSTHF